jgi:hypothetical protein
VNLPYKVGSAESLGAEPMESRKAAIMRPLSALHLSKSTGVHYARAQSA